MSMAAELEVIKKEKMRWTKERKKEMTPTFVLLRLNHSRQLQRVLFSLQQFNVSHQQRTPQLGQWIGKESREFT
jgi:hypothetical protein